MISITHEQKLEDGIVTDDYYFIKTYRTIRKLSFSTFGKDHFYDSNEYIGSLRVNKSDWPAFKSELLKH